MATAPSTPSSRRLHRSRRSPRRPSSPRQPPLWSGRRRRAPVQTTVTSTVAWSDAIAASGESLVQTLPTVDDHRYLPWGAIRTGEFLTGPFGPGDVSETVQTFGGSDIERDGLAIGRIELYQLIDDLRDAPDDAVLDTVSGYTYTPGPQETERRVVSGETILIRRTPMLEAWTWFDNGVIYGVVSDTATAAEADEFVTALIAVQQSAPPS